MQLRRQVGKQAKQRGANAVFGYQQFFDMEGDSGIVGRAYGTACMSISLFVFICSIYPREKNDMSVLRIPSRDVPSPLTDLPALEDQNERRVKLNPVASVLSVRFRLVISYVQLLREYEEIDTSDRTLHKGLDK